jgi:hypothetical protein
MPKKATVTGHDPRPYNGEPASFNKPVESELDPSSNLREIIRMNANVCRLANDLAAAKEEAKLAKEAWEVASQELQSFVAELGREYPLFEQRGA